jgi:hypothetical protein
MNVNAADRETQIERQAAHELLGLPARIGERPVHRALPKLAVVLRN